ncbi:hypothetical protein [Thermogymnomonas acidicola]|uniref:hypothetical protein n=1 Tax=Thermogymnomonas acidicola TaxID=399579 RepID=UPI00094617D6|nr:hypothetical protein [Thermogymnomonas acidicola]
MSWAWYDQASGIVEWKLRNVGGGKGSVILIRDGYVFGGGAFWPVYLKVFGFPVTMDDAPLVNMGGRPGTTHRLVSSQTLTATVRWASSSHSPQVRLTAPWKAGSAPSSRQIPSAR